MHVCVCRVSQPRALSGRPPAVGADTIGAGVEATNIFTSVTSLSFVGSFQLSGGNSIRNSADKKQTHTTTPPRFYLPFSKSASAARCCRRCCCSCADSCRCTCCPASSRDRGMCCESRKISSATQLEPARLLCYRSSCRCCAAASMLELVVAFRRPSRQIVWCAPLNSFEHKST